MKKIIYFVFLTFTTFLFSQEKPIVEFNQDFELRLNGNLINSQTSFNKIIEILGKPELIKEYKTGKKIYAYPELGIALHTYNEKLLMFGANFNWDGDKNFPSKTFSGKLIVGKTQVDISTKKDFLKINNFLKFENFLYPELYSAVTKNSVVVIGFKEEKITQIGFEFKPE